MVVRLRRRGDVWWLDFRWNGQRIRRSADTSNRERAQKLAKLVEARIVLGKTPFPSEPQRGLTFSKHADDWLARVEGGLRAGSFNTYAQAIREVKPLIGSKLMSEVSRSDALAVVSHLIEGEEARRSRKTVANLVGALQSAFEDAVSVQGILNKNPFANKAQLLKAAGTANGRAACRGEWCAALHDRRARQDSQSGEEEGPLDLRRDASRIASRTSPFRSLGAEAR